MAADARSCAVWHRSLPRHPDRAAEWLMKRDDRIDRCDAASVAAIGNRMSCAAIMIGAVLTVAYGSDGLKRDRFAGA